ncbi:MAG: SpoIIE family protein phosphatase [Thermoflexibacter sp.]|nr:SpoIIE family protein phosphatase [Thermoflexibacter sp.]
MDTKIFKGYYRIIYISFSVIFLTALIFVYIQFNSRLDYEKTLIHREFQQSISEFDGTVEASANYLESMRMSVQSYLNDAYSQVNHPFIKEIRNNDKENFFHLDSLPLRTSEYYFSNVTGFGKINEISPTQQKHINAALFLNPLFKNLKEQVPSVAQTYYISTNKDFLMIYPYLPSSVYRINKKSMDRLENLYGNAYPEQNPDKKQVWSSAYIDASGLGMMVTSVLPIYLHKEHVGLLCIDLTLDSLKSITKKSQRKYGEIFVVNSSNQLLAHPKLVASSDTTLKTLADALPSSVNKVAQNLDKIPEKQLYKLGSYYVYYENVPHTDWRMVYIVNAFQTYRTIFADIGGTVLFLLISITAVLVATMIYTRKEFIVPAQNLVKHIRNENGNVKTEVEKLDLPQTWRIWFDIISDIFATNRQMVEQLKVNNAELEKKVAQRTFQIQQKQEEILTQHEALQEQTRKITDSLRYAQTIQEAILPYEQRMKQSFKDYFIMYLPKDIVSGDFYWLSQIKDMTFFAVADCTGHGVPGAFMSMISFALLNEVVNELDIYEPHKILSNLHSLINKALKQGENSTQNNTDGVDIGVVRIIKQANGESKVAFAGAKIPFYYYSEQTGFNMVKGNKKSLSGTHQEDLTFDQYEFILPNDTMLYMATDGYPDQNDANRKKIGMKDFQQILKMNAHLPLKNQLTVLENALNAHQGKEEQRDDITILGVQL